MSKISRNIPFINTFVLLVNIYQKPVSDLARKNKENLQGDIFKVLIEKKNVTHLIDTFYIDYMLI